MYYASIESILDKDRTSVDVCARMRMRDHEDNSHDCCAKREHNLSTHEFNP
jgi:hypothetical protein